MNKGIAPIAIILIIIGVLAVGGGIYYFVTQKESLPQDETADWQTYRNEKYGFELKYPNDWVIFDPSSGLLALKSTQERTSSIQSFFVINITENREIDLENLEASTGTVIEKISIGDHLGYKYFFQEGAGTTEIILIQLDRDVLKLSLDYFASNGSNFNNRKIAIQEIMDPILSTFKFIN